MIITNEQGLPETFVLMATNDDYSKGAADYSVTELIKPTRITHLVQRHSDEIAVDVSDLMHLLMGKAVHKVLEVADQDNAFTEERLFLSIGGRVVSGQTDLYHAAIIDDYKTTSVFAKIYGSRIEEWEAQLNIYAHMYEAHGFPVREVRAIPIYKDWSKNKAKAGGNYPQRQVEVLSLGLWEPENTDAYIRARLRLLIESEQAPDDQLPLCTPEEMWQKPTTYALRKEGRKSALKVEKDLLDLIKWAIEKGHMEDQEDGQHTFKKGREVETRPGGRTRCEDWCYAAPFCNQHQEYLTNQGDTEDE